MIKTILKLIAVIIAGYFLGWIIGGIIGSFVGAIPALFFREIAVANKTLITSVTLVLSIGGIVGFFAIKIINRIFESSDSLSVGVFVGIVIAIIGIFFRYGLLINADDYLSEPRFSLIPVFLGSIIGNYVGSGAFAILGAVRVFREKHEEAKDTNSNRERLVRIKESLK